MQAGYIRYFRELQVPSIRHPHNCCVTSTYGKRKIEQISDKRGDLFRKTIYFSLNYFLLVHLQMSHAQKEYFFGNFNKPLLIFFKIDENSSEYIFLTKEKMYDALCNETCLDMTKCI